MVDEYIEDAEPGNSEIVAHQAREAELARDMEEVTAADPGGTPAPDPVNHLYPVSWADGVTVHTETRKGSEAIQWLPHEAVVHVVCRVKGEAAETRTGKTTHWWDWIDYPVSGFITDARINTGGYPPDVPLCQ